MKLKPQRHKANYKSLALILADIVIVNLAYPIMVLIYWNFRYSPDLMLKLLIRIPFVTLFYIGSYAVSKLYRSVWKYAGIYELFRYAAATAAGTILVWLADYIGMKICRLAGSEILYFNVLPWSIYLDCSLIIICACLAVRLAPRSFKVASAESSRAKRSNTRILILGAGVAGSSLVHEFQQNGYRFGNPVVLVDDDPEKIGRTINGTPIEGGCDRLTQIAKKYNTDEIIFCIKSADEKRKRELLEVAVSTGCKVKIVPDINNLPDGGKANYKEIRNVDILDLLSRPEIKLDPETCKYLTGETVLVTGGGGSIGSELCRQIAKYAPKKIIIFDIYENNAYTLKQALDRHYFGSPEIIIRIGSVRDKARLREVFEEFHPSSVFHAAAHKHVPLMEDSPFEAIKNNTLGTYNTAECANEYKASHFVLLSTDKAVNPTNVMGATKRTCELIIQHFAKISKDTTFAAVRFGNVLGSNGSVIPLFKEQLENGGPLTVTHPDITRYFMTIPEAAQLVVQAGGLAKGGEIFVLNMGEPVKILSLAEKLIKLSGFEPYVDIDIQFTGLRPGEKLYEELVLQSEKDDIHKTQNDKIYVTSPGDIDDEKLISHIEKIRSMKPGDSREFLMELVPTYTPDREA